MLHTGAPLSPVARGSVIALMAAALFGATMPLIQHFGRDVPPFITAALLYAGAAFASVRIRRRRREPPLRRDDLVRVVFVAICGAAVAPFALAWGLQRTDAATASLLLNLEALFTVVLARHFYREAIGRRVAVAVALMAAGGTALAMRSAHVARTDLLGMLAIVSATLGWEGR